MDNTPAEEAGLKPVDVITAIDGTKIESMPELKRKLYQYKENDKAEFTIIRNGQEQKVSITLKAKPGNLQ